MKELIKSKFKEFGVELTEIQVTQFYDYMNFLLQENEKYNLTSITDPTEIVLKHFVDCGLPAGELKYKSKVIDVGSGAGFPGVVLKILREDISITLLDSLQKRVNFLEQLVEKLGLSRVTCVHARAEDYAKSNREFFDHAVSRAVAATNTLSEYLIPFVKVGGTVIMYKGLKAEEELQAGKKAIETLGGKINEVLKYSIGDIGERAVVILKKIVKTNPKYPRGKNLPKTKPIM